MSHIEIGFCLGKSATAEDVTKLVALLRDADVCVEEITKQKQSGVRDGGATIAIAITSLAVSAISAFISALSFWHSTRPKFTVTVKNNGITVSATNLSNRAAHETISALISNSQSDDLKIELTSE